MESPLGLEGDLQCLQPVTTTDGELKLNVSVRELYLAALLILRLLLVVVGQRLLRLLLGR
jgi:hypothetical protein